MDIREENSKQLETMYRRLQSLRQSRGWSIAELSQISGISEKILTEIEKGKDFDVIYLLMLCDIYQIAPHEIFF